MVPNNVFSVTGVEVQLAYTQTASSEVVMIDVLSRCLCHLANLIMNYIDFYF